jgi:hypothetical protein
MQPIDRKSAIAGGARSVFSSCMAVAATVLLLSASSADAKLLKLEIISVQSPAFEGRSFGPVGTYDRIIARATIGVDPADPHNSGIVDVDRAPRAAGGLVEAVGDVEILRPTDPAKGNRRLLYDVLNRGRKLGLSLMNDSAGGNALAKSADAGNGFLMGRGYTIVWSGWQADVAAGDGRMLFSVPVVPGVTGLSREEFVFDNMTDPVTANLTYPTADLDPRRATLTVRQREADPRVTPKDLGFAFEGPDKVTIRRPAGFDAGAIYELIYTAKDPKVLGLGFAATRDIVAFLRREQADTAGTPNPLASRIDKAIALGISQSGRFLRDALYQGFNTDEAGLVVFDGLMPHIAASKMTFVNYRFGQPGRHTQQHMDTVYPGDQFPFSYPVTTDTVTGRTDGILARCLAAGNCPKIMQTDTELEFYQSRASLVVTDTRGEPLALPDNVRAYLMSNLQHFAPANSKPTLNPACAAPTNPLHAGGPMRALLVAMDGWITDGTAPPASRYPSRADSTLVSPTASTVGFPAIPGFAYTGLVNYPSVVDHASMPPVKGAPYPVFVPKTDADGGDLAGIRQPAVEVPVATHVGWNIRKEGFAPGELCDLIGSTLPLARTAAERHAAGDPRPSIAERYPQPGDYAARVARAAQRLVQDRLLLDEDAARITEAAAR